MPLIGCPDCEHTFRVGDLSPGSIITCKKCGAKMEMPDRPLRKRTQVVGSIGGRSDYIDAEDFVAGDKPRRKKNRMNIILNNAFTVALIVGSTSFSILVLLGLGFMISRNVRMPEPVLPQQANMTGEPVNEPPSIASAEIDEVNWQRFVGVWDSIPEPGRASVTRIEFTASKQMIVTGHELEPDGLVGQELPDTRVVGDVVEVQSEGGLIVVKYTSLSLDSGRGASRYRFAANNELIAVLRAGTPEQREVRYHRKG